MSNIKLMRETNIRNVPATLRRIADEIEAGEHYGEVCGAVLALDSTDGGVPVFYCGDGEAGPRAILLMHLAMLKIGNGVLQARDDE
jgi:hypothetical protein